MKSNPIVFTIYLILFFSYPISAQLNPNNDKENVKTSSELSDKQLKRLFSKLTLSEVQAQQVATIYKVYDIKIKAIQAATWEKKNVEMIIMGLHAQRKKALEEILDDNQLASLRLEEENVHKKGKNNKSNKKLSKKHNHESNEQKHLEELTKRLKLTAIQVDQIAAINAKYTIEMKALKATWLDEDGPNKSTIKALKALRETEIHQILTVEQLDILSVMKANKKHLLH